MANKNVKGISIKGFKRNRSIVEAEVVFNLQIEQMLGFSGSSDRRAKQALIRAAAEKIVRDLEEEQEED